MPIYSSFGHVSGRVRAAEALRGKIRGIETQQEALQLRAGKAALGNEHDVLEKLRTQNDLLDAKRDSFQHALNIIDNYTDAEW